MQSHSTRHAVSEALADRHPYKGPFLQTCPGEIAVAYGDRQIPKLIDVLRLDDKELSEPERERCLKLLCPLLTTQENKVKAIQADGLQPLLAWLSHDSSSIAVWQLCCNCLGSICQLQQGRAAFVAAGGVATLTQALVTIPDAAVAAVKVIAGCADGGDVLRSSPVPVTAALVDLIGRPSTTYVAATDAATCITGLCNCDEGVVDALACEAPKCLGQLAARALHHSTALAAGNQQLLGVLRAAGEALLVIAHHEAGKTQIREAECIPVLCQMLEVSDDTVAGHAAACLAALTIEPASKLPVMAAASQSLANKVKEGKPVIATAAQTALLSAAEDLDARRKLELLLGGRRELQELLGQLPQVPHDYKYVVWSSENPPA